MDVTPLIGPLVALLKSRKFLTALVGLILNVLVAYIPALESVQTELMTVLTALFAIVIGGIAYEDAAKTAP